MKFFFGANTRENNEITTLLKLKTFTDVSMKHNESQAFPQEPLYKLCGEESAYVVHTRHAWLTPDLSWVVRCPY